MSQKNNAIVTLSNGMKAVTEATNLASEEVAVVHEGKLTRSPERSPAHRWDVMKMTPFGESITFDDDQKDSYTSEEVALAALDQKPYANLDSDTPSVYFIRAIIATDPETGKTLNYTDKVRYKLMTRDDNTSYVIPDPDEKNAFNIIKGLKKDRQKLAFKASDSLAATALKMALGSK